MILAHISDLHIGKRLNEFSLLEDQRHILSQICDIIDRRKADALLIAGDVYDKSVPSAEGVRLLDDFLTQLAARDIPVFMISGNHDSPERTAFASRILDGQGIHISPVYDGTVCSHTLSDKFGTVKIWLLPFVRPAAVRHCFPDAQIESYDDAVRVALSAASPDPAERNVLVSHQFVTGASRCDSEESTVGGIDNIDVSAFDAFDYVALGHIHSPQSVGREAVRYCGTPLKYSFSECAQQKSVTIVELLEKGNVSISTEPLTPLHDMRKIRGTYMELTARENYIGTATDDYLHVTLTDEEDIPAAIGRLRAVYPNIMSMEYDNIRTRQNRVIDNVDIRAGKSEWEYFSELYKIQNNKDMTAEQTDYLRGLIEKIKDGRQ